MDTKRAYAESKTVLELIVFAMFWLLVLILFSVIILVLLTDDSRTLFAGYAGKFAHFVLRLSGSK